MDQIEFADGFDRPDTLAFGLGAGQLAVVMAGCAGGVLAGSLAAAAGHRGSACGVARRRRGRARVAARCGAAGARLGRVRGLFWMRPRRGAARWELASGRPGDGATPDEAARPAAAILELFGKADSEPERPRDTICRQRRGATPDQRPTGDRNLSRVIRPMRRADGARRVTFFSLRGGTGRSTLATELTCLLAASHSEHHPAPKVALVDLDLRSPSVAVRLGAPERTLLDFALAPPEDRSVIDFMVRHASGAHVLLGPQRAVNPEWPVTPALLREVLRELDMEGFDLVVLDVCPELTPLDHHRDLRVR